MLPGYEVGNMKQTTQEQKISQLVQPVIQDKGYELVAVTLQGNLLQIMAENPETKNLGVDECAVLSREISAILDVEDPIQGAYRLEISSPGIDRPLVKLQDFAEFEGFETKMEISPGINGQKKFRGRIVAVEDDNIELQVDNRVLSVPYESIVKAKLVLTDDLLNKNKK